MECQGYLLQQKTIVCKKYKINRNVNFHCLWRAQFFVQEDMILHEYSKSDIRNIQKFPLIVKVTSLVKAGMI